MERYCGMAARGVRIMGRRCADSRSQWWGFTTQTVTWSPCNSLTCLARALHCMLTAMLGCMSRLPPKPLHTMIPFHCHDRDLLHGGKNMHVTATKYSHGCNRERSYGFGIFGFHMYVEILKHHNLLNLNPNEVILGLKDLFFRGD